MSYGQVDKSLQAGASESRQSGDPQTGAGGRAEVAGGARRRADRRQAPRYRHEARGPLPPRFDPRRRHRHRRPAARSAGAALPRSALRHAGHPVQHEVGGEHRTGEVRLSRPEDPDCARHRGEAGRPPRHPRRSAEARAGGPTDLHPARQRRDGRRVPAGIDRHAQSHRRHQAGPFRGHHRAGGAVPAGTDGQHPGLRCPQTGGWRRPTICIRCWSRC